MKKGIAKQFKERYPNIQAASNKFGPHLTVLKSGNKFIYNLITKNHFWEKPTYRSMKLALIQMKKHMRLHQVESIGLPTIGCGLDRLNWKMVKSLIWEIFRNETVETEIYHIN